MRPGPMEPRRLFTLSGEIVYQRTVFHCRTCRTSLAPLDAEVGAAPGSKFTNRVRRAVAYAAAESSFAAASAAMKENFTLAISTSQVALIANSEGERIAASAEERERQWRDGERPAERSPEDLVLLVDATSVLTRSGEEHKMVNLVRAYDLSDRATPPLPGDEGTPEASTKKFRPTLAQSRYAGTACDEAARGGLNSDLAARILALGCRLGAPGAKRLVFLADGNPTVQAICEELYPEAIQILDFWHAAEYLSKSAKVVTKTPADADALRHRWSEILKRSGLPEIEAELGEHHRRLRGQEKRETLRKALEYLRNNRDRMDYARYQAEGLPIGSGPIEAACKHLVKERYNIAGARWSRAKTGNILALRLAIANEEWELHWARIAAHQLSVA